MKYIAIIKNILRSMSRTCGFMYFIYIISISFARAANLQPFSADDIVTLSLLGAVVGILFIADYSLRTVYSALKRQYRKTYLRSAKA